LLVASVVTEEAERGQGHGGRLLQSLLAGHPDRPMILFSDIAPRYYERFGFELCPVTVVEGPAGGSASCGWPLTVAEFSAWLGERRSRLVRGAGKAATSLLPAPLFLEWKLLRYRHLADVAGSLFPNAHC